MTEFLAAIMVILGFVSLFFVLLVVSTLLNGWVFSILWAWFIIPVFGLPALTIGQAIGLSMVVTFLTYQYVDNQKSDKETNYAVIVLPLAKPFMYLAIGYVVKLVMF